MNEELRFLIVDDSPYDRELIRRTLHLNFPDATFVEVFHEQGLTEALGDLAFSFVCTDYFLKWTTGLDVLHAIRARSATIPIIMVTDTGSEEIAAEAMKQGLTDYVLKTHLARLPIAITECQHRMQLQDEHRSLQAQLEHVQKMESLGLLVSGIAHDFNNLLGGIMGYAQRGMAQANAPKQSLQQYFAHIYERAEQGARMTRQLLAFARGTPLEAKHIQINEQITSSLDLIRTSVGTTVEVDFQPDAALQSIYADPTQLEQILMNLCLNARDAMPTGGRLTIKTQQVEIQHHQQHLYPHLPTGSYALISICDTGIGMDEATQERLFEPFFTTKDVGQGTGLGLAVVYGIVKQHHGVIRVQSQLGQGTTFSLYFPSVEVAATTRENPEPMQSAASLTRSGTVLLVEDDLDLQSVMAEVLEDDGYTVLLAGDGEEGLRLFHAHAATIALVVADVMMPKMQGRAFQEFVRQQQPLVKILVMSGYQEMDLKRRDLLDPNSMFLQKPFDLDVFSGTVQKLLGTPEHQDR